MALKISNAQFALTGVIALGLGISIAFQNCSSQEFSNNLVQPSGTVVDKSNMDKIPFAFDFQPTQISYMSCSRTGDKATAGGQAASTTHLNDPNVFFTFKVGAYDNGGLGLRQEFIDYVKTNFTYKGALADKEIQDAFTYGTAHGGAALQLAGRATTPIASSLTIMSGATPTFGVDYGLFPDNVLLTNLEFLNQLVTMFKSNSTRLTALGESGLQKYPLESAIHYENQSGYNELTSESIRKNFAATTGANSTLLSVTYSQDLRLAENSGVMHVARAYPSTTSNNRIWGKGYKMTFASDPRMSWKQSILSTMQEYDLTTFQPSSSTWTCPSYFRFIIISPQHRGSPITTMKADRSGTYSFTFTETNETTLVNNQTEWSKYSAVRRHFPSAQWMIDWTNQAISPRQSNLDCYGNVAFNPVDYAGNGSRCGLDDNNFYLHKDCAEFASICVKQ